MNIINKTFNIKYFDLNRRIDNWIFSNFKNIPKSAIYCMIRKGSIRINNKKMYPSYKLQINDNITINNFFYINNDNDNKNIKNKLNYNIFKINILFEDKYILIINKNPGISVHGGTNINYNIISYLRSNYNKNYELVHRLDKFSSGILIIAKNKLILRKLHYQFNLKKIKKKYIILTCGKWNEKNKIINLPIKKEKNKYKKNIFIVNNNGKKSISVFKILKNFNDATLLEVTIITGRTHQIRVHSSYLGNPIAMDNIYGNIKINRKFLSKGLKRIFLHSNYIKFIHPINNKIIKINCELNDDLKFFLKKLKN